VGEFKESAGGGKEHQQDGKVREYKDPGEDKHTQVWRSWERTFRSKVRVSAHFELGNSPKV
jgi:hypothetical protein